MKYEEIRHAWNAQADEFKQWAELGLIEKVEWAARLGAAKERAARQAAQAEVVELKERIARAGVEHRRALHEALQQEREACAQVQEAALKVVSDALNDLVEACHGYDGKLKAPNKKELMRARSMLPPRCSYTLTKKI